MQENWKSERQEKRAAKATKKKAKQTKKPPTEASAESSVEAKSTELQAVRLAASPAATPLSPVASVEVVYQPGVAGTGQPFVEYPQLNFELFALFVLGSPIGMFLTVR